MITVDKYIASSCSLVLEILIPFEYFKQIVYKIKISILLPYFDKPNLKF